MIDISNILQRVLLSLIFISFIFLFISSGYLDIIIRLIGYLLFGGDIIFSFTFFLTIIYQFCIQLIKINKRSFYFIMYLLFSLSVFIPFLGASLANSTNLALQYISYIVLSITSIPPLVAIALLINKETGYRNPLKLIILFSTALINILILVVAKNLAIDSLGSLQINKLGIYELYVFLSYYQAIASLIYGSMPDQQTLSVILNLKTYSYNYLIPLVLFASFIYAIMTIFDNIKIYEKEIYYKEKLKVSENKEIYFYIAGVSFIGVFLAIIITSTIQYLFMNVDPIYSTLIILIPFIISITIIILGRK